MTVDVRPKSTGETLQELSQRLYRVEQESSRPSGGGGGGGSSDPHPSVDTITIDGIVVGSDASPVTGLTLDTGSFMDDIWVDADWTAPADGTAGSYDVELARKVGSSYELVQVFHTGGTSLRMSALWPQTTYGVRVTAINRIDVRSDPEPPIGFEDITTGIDATIPDQVVGVAAVAGIKTVTVVWAENAENDVAHGNGTYEVTLSPAADFSSPSVVFTSGTIAVFSYLNSGTQYWGRVRAVDASGNAGPYSATVTATTGQVQPVDLADAAVTTSKLANLAVDNSKLAALAVDAAKLADSAVTPTKIANLAVGSAAIAALAVGTAHIQDASIIQAKIGNLAVGSAQIADLAVTTAKIENLAVDNGKIANLDAGKINAGTISADRIAANSLDVNKLTTSTLTSKTITIGAGGVLKIGNAPTTGVLVNDQGIRLYSGGVVKVALDVLGTASFEGNISASTITSSTLTSATINSGTITGVTITGATVRTASSGQRVAFESGVQDRIKLYTGTANEIEPGSLQVGGGVGFLEVSLRGPKASGGHAYPNIMMQSYDSSTGDTQLNFQIRNGDDSIKSHMRYINKGSGETVSFSCSGWFEEAFFDFLRTGTNAQMRLKGSGDYCFIFFHGGGATSTLNVNIGLGSGLHVMDGTNATFHPIQASAFNIASAASTKRNIRAEGKALDRLRAMKVVRFQRNYQDLMKAPPSHIQRFYDLEEVGFLADEMLSTVPEAVVLDGNNNPVAINLAVVTALLVKSVQEINELLPGRS